MSKFPDAGWVTGEVEDPNDWIQELMQFSLQRVLSPFATGRLSTLAMSVSNLLTPLAALMDPDTSDDEDATGVDDTGDHHHVEDGADRGEQTGTTPIVESGKGPLQSLGESIEQGPASSAVVDKGKGRETEPEVQTGDKAPTGDPVEKTLEPSIVVKKVKPRVAGPESKDSEEYATDGERLVFNDPVVSRFVMIIFFG
jgi:hypothetical protein